MKLHSYSGIITNSSTETFSKALSVKGMERKIRDILNAIGVDGKFSVGIKYDDNATERMNQFIADTHREGVTLEKFTSEYYREWSPYGESYGGFDSSYVIHGEHGDVEIDAHGLFDIEEYER